MIWTSFFAGVGCALATVALFFAWAFWRYLADEASKRRAEDARAHAWSMRKMAERRRSTDQLERDYILTPEPNRRPWPKREDL
jgi:uncharacterized membrane protein YccC